MSALKHWIDRRRPENRSSKYGPIGVYLTQEQLHVVQLRRLNGGEIGFQSRVSLAYPGTRIELLSSPAATQKLIRRAMRSGRFRGRTVVSAMPPEQVRVMSIAYPANSAENEARVIAKLMADRLEGPLADHVIDYVPIRMSSRDGDRLALVAVSSLENVSNYLDRLGAAGLEVDYLEIGPLAIKRLIEWGPASSQKNNVIVINVGISASHLTTISGHRLLADQEIAFGEYTVLGQIAKSLTVTPNQARELVLEHGLDLTHGANSALDGDGDLDISATLVEIIKPALLKLVNEIERAFLFADSESQGLGQRKLFVVGGVARWPGAPELLGKLVNMPVEILGRAHLPINSQSPEPESINDQQAAEMSTAVGLALRGMMGDG